MDLGNQNEFNYFMVRALASTEDDCYIELYNLLLRYEEDCYIELYNLLFR